MNAIFAVLAVLGVFALGYLVGFGSAKRQGLEFIRRIAEATAASGIGEEKLNEILRRLAEVKR